MDGERRQLGEQVALEVVVRRARVVVGAAERVALEAKVNEIFGDADVRLTSATERELKRLWAQLRELYQPFVDRLYAIVEKKGLRVSPCEDQGTRFLDAPNVTNHG